MNPFTWRRWDRYLARHKFHLLLTTHYAFQYQGLMAYTVHLEHDEGRANLTFEGVKDIGLVFTTDPQAKSIVRCCSFHH